MDDRVNCATSEIGGGATKLLASITSTWRQFIVTRDKLFEITNDITLLIHR